MVADAERTLLTEDEVVDLDTLTTEELLKERRAVMFEIDRIGAQLRDKDRRPPTLEDDSPEWDDYRDWRRRARWAFVFRRKELQDIKQILSERKDTGTVGHFLKIREADPEAYAERMKAAAEKNRRTVEALHSTGLDAMLLRVFRVWCHSHPPASGLPEGVDERDRETLHELSLFLRQTYGNENVHRFVNDLLDPLQ